MMHTAMKTRAILLCALLTLCMAGAPVFAEESRPSAQKYNSYVWDRLIEGDADKAERAIKEALGHYPDHQFLNTNLAHVHLFQGRYDEAWKVIAAWKDRPFEGESKAFVSWRHGFMDDYRIFYEKRRRIWGRRGVSKEVFPRFMELWKRLAASK